MLKKFKFKELYIDYYKYPLGNKVDIEDMLNKNRGINEYKNSAEKVSFRLDTVKDIRDAEELSKILSKK